MFPLALPPAPSRRLGAVTLTPDLSTAATGLVSALATGCPAVPFDACSGFQQTYVAAGGAWADLGITGSSPDGLYGPKSQAALQTVLTAMGSTSAAPQACVGAGTIVPALSPTMTPAAVPAGSIAIGPWVVSKQTLLVGTAAAIALALVGSAIYKHYADQEALTLAFAPARRSRRRNPSKARRARAQARVRADGAVRDRKGRFLRGGQKQPDVEPDEE